MSALRKSFFTSSLILVALLGFYGPALADSIPLPAVPDGQTSAATGAMCADQFSFVVGIRVTRANEISKISFSCAKTIYPNSSWDPSQVQTVEFDHSANAPGTTSGSACAQGSFAVGFDFSLWDTERTEGITGPTLHFKIPSDLRMICTTPLQPDFGTKSSLQDRRLCPAGEAVNGLFYQKSGDHLGTWGMDCATFRTPVPIPQIGGTAVPTIRVQSGTYGASCHQPMGNVTQPLANACNGKAVCEYTVDYHVIGDPAPGCKKDYIAKWTCGAGHPKPHVASAPAEAGYGSKVTLSCSAQ